jgi:hypothetical protein
MKRILCLSIFLGLALASLGSWAAGPNAKQIASSFEQLRVSLEKKDKTLFLKYWHPRGFKKNLVGSSGLPGVGVFKQGSRKGWYLKPKMSTLKARGTHGAIVFCAIWSTRRKRAVDGVHAYVVWHNKRWVVLAAGESKKQVEALIKREQAGARGKKK